MEVGEAAEGDLPCICGAFCPGPALSQAGRSGGNAAVSGRGERRPVFLCTRSLHLGPDRDAPGSPF